MNGLLNETVVRVVLMVKVITPGRNCDPIADPARRTSPEAACYETYRLSSAVAEQNCTGLSREWIHLMVNGKPLKRLTYEQFCTVSAFAQGYCEDEWWGDRLAVR